MSAQPDTAASIGSSALLAATRRMLRPLVGLLIRRGITFPVIVDLLRGLYVDVAASDLLSDPKARTDSRISLMTGVHRKEIRRQRSSYTREPREPEIVTITTQVVARWLAWAEAGAPPPPLPRGAGGKRHSFEDLVASVTTDIRPRALLEEWAAQGLVQIDETDHVHLNVAAFLPDPGSDEQAFFLGRNLADHIAAGAANVLAPAAAPFLDRSAHYDKVSPDVAHRIEAVAREITTRALRDINQMALDEIDRARAAMPEVAPNDQAPNVQAPNDQARVNVGVYIYRQDAPTASEQRSG